MLTIRDNFFIHSIQYETDFSGSHSKIKTYLSLDSAPEPSLGEHTAGSERLSHGIFQLS